MYRGLCGREEWNNGLQHRVRYLCESERELCLFREICTVYSSFWYTRQMFLIHKTDVFDIQDMFLKHKTDVFDIQDMF